MLRSTSARGHLATFMAWLIATGPLFVTPFGQIAHADPDHNVADTISQVHAEQELPPGSPEQLGIQALEAIADQGENAHLNLNDEQRNVFYILSQKRVDFSFGLDGRYASESLADLDLTREIINIPKGILARSLSAKVDGNGILLSYPGSKWGHKIEFNKGEMIRSVSVDSEYVLILLEDSRVLTISIDALEKVMFNAATPVFTIGKTHENADSFKNVTGLRLIRRRALTTDRSRRAQEAQLDRLSGSRRLVMAIANPQLADDMAENYEKARYIPLASDIAADIAYLSELDLALVEGEPGDETIVRVIPRQVVGQAVSDQGGAFQALQALASDETDTAIKAIAELEKAGQQELANILRSPERIVAFLQGGQAESLANIPADLGKKIVAHANQIVAGEQDITSRDRFTPAEWQEDSNYFAETVNYVHAASENKTRLPVWFRRIAFKVSERWQKLQSPAAVQKMTNIVKCGAAACAVGVADHFTGGHARQLGIDVLSGSMNWLLNKFPVLLDKDYRGLLALSVGFQAAIPGLIYLTSTLVAPFTQYSAMRLPPIVGIRSFARIFQISPLRVLASLTGQQVAFRAMKRGVFVAPIDPATTSTEFHEQQANEEVRRRTLSVSLSTLAALGVVSFNEKVDAGQLYATVNGIDLSTKEGQALALDITDIVDEELKAATPEEFQQMVDKDQAKLVAAIHSFRQASKEVLEAGANKSWWQRTKEYWKTKAKIRFMKRLGNYNEQTYHDLVNAVPDEFTSRIINRGYLVDYLVSLGVASTTGAWADLSDPKLLHAQRGTFMLTNPQATTENVNQTAIWLMRGAANNYMTLSAETSGVNFQAAPAELVDSKEVEVPGMRGFFRESWEFTKALFDFRNGQPGEIGGRMAYNGRVKLFQSTLTMALLPRMLLGHQGFEEALLGQFLFMATAMWRFGWPWDFIYGAQSVHEGGIEANYKALQKLQVKLSQTHRLNQEELAQQAIANMQEFYAEHRKSSDIAVPDLPERQENESAVSFAKVLYDFTMRNPCVPHKHSGLVAGLATMAGGVSTTIMAIYLFVDTFQGSLTWMGYNLTDWNLFTQIPEGDGIFSLAAKSAIFTTLMWSGQKFFNWMWDYARLNVPYFLTPTAEKRDELQQRYEAAKEDLLNFSPVRRAIQLGALVGKPVQRTAAAVGRSVRAAGTYVRNKCSLVFGNKGDDENGPDQNDSIE